MIHNITHVDVSLYKLANQGTRAAQDSPKIRPALYKPKNYFFYFLIEKLKRRRFMI